MVIQHADNPRLRISAAYEHGKEDDTNHSIKPRSGAYHTTLQMGCRYV